MHFASVHCTFLLQHPGEFQKNGDFVDKINKKMKEIGIIAWHWHYKNLFDKNGSKICRIFTLFFTFLIQTSAQNALYYPITYLIDLKN